MKKLSIILLISIFFACSKEDTDVNYPINGVWKSVFTIANTKDTGIMFFKFDTKQKTFSFTKSYSIPEYLKWNRQNFGAQVKIKNISSNYFYIDDNLFVKKDINYTISNDSLYLPNLFGLPLTREY